MRKLFVLFLFLPIIAQAAPVLIDGIYYNIDKTAKSAEVTNEAGDSSGADCYSGVVVIPQTVEYEGIVCEVTSIGKEAFLWCNGLTAVTIPSSVTSIDDFAFQECNGLTAITIPESVDSIGTGAFIRCENLASVDFTEGLDFIGWAAFKGCKKLTSVVIPNSVTTVYNYAFEGCESLSHAVLSKNIQWVNGETFLNCTNLSRIDIFNNCISSRAFSGCSSLDSIVVHMAFPPDYLMSDAFDAETYTSATLFVPTGRKAFFQENDEWGAFASIAEMEMAGVDIPPSPFDNLYSKRLVLSYTDSNSGGSMGDDGEDDIVHAVKFPTERMTRIKGNQITHIRFNLFDRFSHISNVRVFIGSSRDNRDLAYQPVDDLQEGWNEVALSQPYTITGDSIVVGVEYHKGEEDILYPVKWGSGAIRQEGACLLLHDESWTSAGRHWSEHEGTWLIQCMVEGDNVPAYDLHFEELIEPLYKRWVKAGEPFDFTLKLRNWGSMPIKNLQMQALLDGRTIDCQPNWDYEIARGTDQQHIVLQVTPSEDTPVGSYQLCVSPKTINGELFAGNDISMCTPLRVYKHDMGRQKVLVQVYTGTWCGYCPDFDSLVEEKQEERGDLAVVSIHSRDIYYITPASESYLSMMYTDGFPNVDLNRCVTKSLYNFREAIMNHDLDDAKSQPAFADVHIFGHYDEDSHVLSVTVSGERNEDFIPVEGWTHLTVLLVEDDIIGKQWGYDFADYHHPAVIRTNISSIWGDKVEWNGDQYEMHYATSLDNLKNINGTWNVNNMRIVAFLSKPFTGSNYEEIHVVNCNEIAVKALPSAIKGVTADRTKSDVYGLNGQKIRSNSATLQGLPKGVYIVGGKKFVKF